MIGRLAFAFYSGVAAAILYLGAPPKPKAAGDSARVTLTAAGPRVTYFFHNTGGAADSTITSFGLNNTLHNPAQTRAHVYAGNLTSDTATFTLTATDTGFACVQYALIGWGRTSQACKQWTWTKTIVPPVAVGDSVTVVGLLLDTLQNVVRGSLPPQTITSTHDTLGGVHAPGRALYCAYFSCTDATGYHFVTRNKYPATVADWVWRAALCDSVGRAHYGNLYRT